ncbi:MAG: leucine-rich repeat domain-containing protein [Lachnospiraceae bacterium]
MLTKVTFADNTIIETIGDDAFGKCRSLAEIKLPSSMKSIGSRAFWDCTALTTMTISASVTEASSGNAVGHG